MRRTVIAPLIVVTIALFVASELFGQSGAAGRGRGRAAPANYELTIRSNVQDANITINGNSVRGSLPQSFNLDPGNYRIVLSRDGYQSAARSVTLDSNTTVTINLEPITRTLNIRSNVNGATVYIDGNRRGSGSILLDLQPGTYELRISADGYLDFTRTVRLNSNETVNANLQPAFATLRMEIPSEYLNSEEREGYIILVDGERQSGTTVQVRPGRHEITFIAGAIRVTESFVFQPNTEYRLTPTVDLELTQ